MPPILFGALLGIYLFGVIIVTLLTLGMSMLGGKGSFLGIILGSLIFALLWPITIWFIGKLH